MSLQWPDYLVIVAYLAGMLLLGLRWALRRTSDEEYFLVGRRMPWLAVGISVVASMISSITYLAEPGEVWRSGVTHILGKMIGIAIETALIWTIFIPFLMRFRFTSAYEYLELRYGRAARRTGTALFVAMTVLWMGFVVLVLSQVVEELSGIPLWSVIFTVGIVATSYTMLGGLRVVIWTDVIQVAFLVTGAVVSIAYISYTTGSWIPDWLAATSEYVRSIGQPTAIPILSWDPTLRATVVSVAINMAIWHICIHSSNQMTVQRYFSTRNVSAARRSFLTSAVVNVFVSLLLVCVGIAVLYFYTRPDAAQFGMLDPTREHDLIFPSFALHHLPVGFGGTLVAALLAAAMSSLDSGLNSIATVVSLELRPTRPTRNAPATTPGRPRSERHDAGADTSHVRLAKWLTLAAGLLITGAAYVLSFMPSTWGIVAAIPRTFNAITGPLGGMFLVGIFLPRVRQRAMIVATVLGLVTSIVLGYLQQVSALLENWRLLTTTWPDISYTWIMPCSLVVTCVTAPLLWPLDRREARDLSGLTWYTRHAPIPSEGAERG